MNHIEKKRFILNRFPQLQLVTKPQWVDAACEAWAKVWEMSSWENIDAVPANLLTPSASLLNHVCAAVDNCIQVAKVRESIHGDKVDMDVLIVAGVLHDASKALEYELRDGQARVSRLGELYQHGFFAAHIALEAGFPMEVVHIILTHTDATRACPKTLEGILLFYCDTVDADLNRLRDHAPLIIPTCK